MPQVREFLLLAADAGLRGVDDAEGKPSPIGNIAQSLLTALQEEIADKLEFHADEISSKILKNAKKLEDDELYTEYLDYILGVKIVKNRLL